MSAEGLGRTRTFLCGAAAAGLAALAVAFGVIETGVYDATAISPHDPVSAWVTHTTMIHSVQRNARTIEAPRRFTGQQVLAGLREYGTDCAMCHGAPAVAHAQWVDGMTPAPPYLLDAARHWSARELFYIVRNGVKMTAMPAWGLSRSDVEVWDMVAFLEALPAISPAEYANLDQTRPPISPGSRFPLASRTGGR